MPPRRLLPLVGPTVTLIVDGRDVPARAGETVAAALLAQGRWVFGRSVKYHRARGPVCMSGRCEGCLLRIDGVPSVMSCRTEVQHGMRCDAQNVVGSSVLGGAEHDVLAMTDFLFPEGLDHHEMFTWSKPANRAMQLIAREIAGVGTLPDEVEAAGKVERHDVEVLVVGGGLAGLGLATKVAAQGARTLLLDEESGPAPHLAGAAREASEAGAQLLWGKSALGLFGETDGRRIVLADAVGDGSAHTIAPRVVVIATGCAETGALFEGNDLPGVVNGRAAERLLDQGILVGQSVVLAAQPNDKESIRVASRLRQGGAKVKEIDLAKLQRARGRTGVRSVETTDGTHGCDVLVVCSPRAPITELAQQAGVKVQFADGRFVLDVNPDGSTAHPDTFVVGGAATVDVQDLLPHLERTASAVQRRLESSRG